MSLFDYIEVDRSVNLPPIPGYTGDLYVRSFQTKDLECFMTSYFIKDDALFVKNVTSEWVEHDEAVFGGYMSEISSEVVPELFTGSVTFYDMIKDFDDRHDGWVDLSAVFVNGKLVSEIALKSLKLVDSTTRKQSEQAYRNAGVARAQLEKSWYFPVVRAKEWIAKQLSNVLFTIASRVIALGSSIQRLAFKTR